MPRQQTALRYDSERGHKKAIRMSELRPQLPKLRLVETEVPEHPNKYGNTQLRTKYGRGIPEELHGSRVGALSSWCNSPLESGGTLPLQGDAAQPLRLTPRMAEVATAQPLLQENSGETSTEKRQKREENETEHPTERQARRPSRGSWNVTPAAWKNS